MNDSVVMIGCFDTKAEDFCYLYTSLKKYEIEIITINIGVLGSTKLFPIAYESNVVADAGGVSIQLLRKNKDRSKAIKVMGLGAYRMLEQLLKENKVRGVIGMGGGGGTYMTLAAMQAIPFGIPKLCISTLAAKDLSEHIGSKDITLISSIVDVAGVNSISSVVMGQATGALYGMMKASKVISENKGTIAISTFGNTTVCIDKCSEILTALNYDVLTFHSVGVGGITMENLILDGCIDAVLDVTTTELADELCGGICSAGPNRLNAAGNIGIPQVIVPGCLDMVNFGALDSVPKKYVKRQLYSWAPDVTLMRTNKVENEVLGKTIANKANSAKEKVVIMIPLGGISKIGAKGEVFYNPEIDKVLFRSIKENTKDTIKIIEIDANINTSAFAVQATNSLLELIKETQAMEKYKIN